MMCVRGQGCFRGLAAYPAGYAAAQGVRFFANARNKGFNDLKVSVAQVRNTDLVFGKINFIIEMEHGVCVRIRVGH